MFGSGLSHRTSNLKNTMIANVNKNVVSKGVATISMHSTLSLSSFVDSNQGRHRWTI